MHWRYTLWILRGRVHVRASLDQVARELRMAEKDRQSDRRIAVVAVRIQQRRIPIEQCHCPFSVADRAGFGQRELRTTLRK